MSQSRPLIGMVCYGRGKDAKLYTMPMAYIEAVRSSGGSPLMLPPGAESVRPYLEIFDGFILAGGGDVDPQHYGQAPHQNLYGVDPERDATELELARVLAEQRVPLLAICRGLQVLNVALGGDLIQDLTDAVGETVRHQGRDGEAAIHSVTAVAGSQVAQLCGIGPFEVASNHHQAASRLGSCLHAVARTEDGIVEAIEFDDHPEILGVQWHPELTASQDLRQRALFDWLVSRARGRGRSR